MKKSTSRDVLQEAIDELREPLAAQVHAVTVGLSCAYATKAEQVRVAMALLKRIYSARHNTLDAEQRREIGAFVRRVQHEDEQYGFAMCRPQLVITKGPRSK